MWSQINFLSSIRLTGGQQIDFKVFEAFAVEIFLESQSFLNFRKSIVVEINNKYFQKVNNEVNKLTMITD